MKIEKSPIFPGRTDVYGHATEAEAQAHLGRLRSNYETGYGFVVVSPIQKSADGTWAFTYWRGSSAD